MSFSHLNYPTLQKRWINQRFESRTEYRPKHSLPLAKGVLLYWNSAAYLHAKRIWRNFKKIGKVGTRKRNHSTIRISWKSSVENETRYLCLAMPAPILWPLHSETHIGSVVNRKTWPFTATGVSSTPPERLWSYCKSAVQSSPSRLRANRTIMRWLKHSLRPSKKKRRTAESTPRSRTSGEAWNSTLRFIMKPDRTERWNIRRRKHSKMSI